ncbi:unnamed protein product [Penicillium salamii]|nr:unnamed protein product [Penicillium salamii]
MEWLQTAIGFDDHIRLCKFAHDNRHPNHMKHILGRDFEDERRSGPTSRRSSFVIGQYYIGRLAHYKRAIKELIRDTQDLSPLLENHAILKIYASSAVTPPIRNSHSNLPGILNRMLKNNDSQRKTCPRMWSSSHVQQFDNKNSAATHQKDILSKITQDLREQVIQCVLQRLASTGWHPDSTTKSQTSGNLASALTSSRYPVQKVLRLSQVRIQNFIKADPTVRPIQTFRFL